MSAARRMQRAQQAQQRREQPPTVGAVDLAGLKGGVSKQQREQVRRDLLSQNSLLCSCGRLVADEGVVLFSYGEGLIDTPQGPQPGIQFATSTFCSRECPVLVGTLSVEYGHDMPHPIALRPLPPTEWLVSREELLNWNELSSGEDEQGHDGTDDDEADPEDREEPEEAALTVVGEPLPSPSGCAAIK